MKKDKFVKINCVKPSHSYLFIGSYNDSRDYIISFLDKLNINKFDRYCLDFVDSIKIEDIRKIQHQASLKPYSSKFKAIIIEKAEKLTSQSANALLKTIEEPPNNSIIILSALNEKNLIGTIASRCRVIKTEKKNISQVSNEEKKQIEEIFKMSMSEKFNLANTKAKEINLENFIDSCLIYIEEKTKKDKKYFKLLKKIHRFKNYINSNVNSRLMLENIMLEME